MMKARFLIALTVCLTLPIIASAGGLKLYPGAKLNPALSSQATKSSEGSMRIGVYTTTASFDKVATYYKTHYREDKSGEPPTQIKGSRAAVFILDGASSLLMSKHYLQVKESGPVTYLYDTASAH